MYKNERAVQGLKVRYIGDYYKFSLIKGNVYEVIAIHDKMRCYRIVDETGEDYLFSVKSFEVVHEADA